MRNSHVLYTQGGNTNGSQVVRLLPRSRLLHSPSVVTAGLSVHDDVIKWKHFPRYWSFVRVIHRSPVNSPHTGQ